MSQSITFTEVLAEAIKGAGRYNKNIEVAPDVILWPDKERQWEPLLPELRQRLPLLTLGDYEPDNRIGPAYWLRCMLDRTLPDDQLPDDVIPIIYLPGVSKQELRAIEECPKFLKPLAELQYRGTLWVHRNGRDWTIAGFLQSSEDGLDVEVGADSATKEAMQRALLRLAFEPVAHLKREAPLKAQFFDDILNPDQPRRMLLWLNNPQEHPKQISADEWDSFCEVCQRKYKFHPKTDGEVTAAEFLGKQEGEWAVIWQRFSEAPEAYPNLPDLLARARPTQLSLFELSPAWPQDNEEGETRLRQRLMDLENALPNQLRTTISKLEQEHAKRRKWVWARLGRSPLAFALEHLATLAQVTEKTLGGTTIANLADAYAEWGWQADAAVIDALAAVEKAEDVTAVKKAITPLYRPWLENAATAMQNIIANNPTDGYTIPKLPQVEHGTCIVFCDALRFDAGQRLIAGLKDQGLRCQSRWHLAALPTVTPTSKPAVSPVANRILGGGKSDLTPVVKESGADITASTLRKLLDATAFQVLIGDDLGHPSGQAWTEQGAIDRYGHDHGWKIAHHLGAELRILEGRIEALLDHSWQRVIVVTDHGWLMLPQGFPKVELPQHLTLKRKGRCAVLKEGTDTDQQTVPWHWDSSVHIAVASGIRCYETGKEYEHGGISPQECIVPLIVVSKPAEAVMVTIEKVNWRRLRCAIQLAGASGDMLVDIRSKAGDPTTSLVATPRTPKADGSISLVVPDEDREGDAVIIVVLDQDGIIQTQAPTIIGD